MGKVQEMLIELRKELRNGKYPAGCRFPSQYDLALRFDVNKITANKVVSLLVGEGFLTRGLKRHDGTLVRCLSPSPNGRIAFLTNLSPFYDSMLNGAMQTAFRYNYDISLFSPSIEALDITLERLENYGFDGILTNTYGVINQKTRLPVVYIEKCNLFGNPNYYQVHSDCEKGGGMIADHLVANGHRKILYFSCNYENIADRPRLVGMMNRLNEVGIPFGDKQVFFSHTSQPVEIRSILKKMLKLFPDATAVTCGCDSDAEDILHACCELKIKVPSDLSLCGFGNTPYYRKILPLVTIEQHPLQLGVRGCEKLIEILENPGMDIIPEEIFPVNLVHGDSVRKL